MSAHLGRMTLREKLAQKVFIDFRFDEADYDLTMRLVKKEGVGGVRLSGGSIFDVPGFVNSIQRVAKFPLLVAADYADGPGWEVSGATAFPPQRVVTTEDLSQLKARHTAMEARALGVRWVSAPGFSAGAEAMNLAFLKGLHSVGVLAGVRGRPKERTPCAAEVDVILETALTAEGTNEIRTELDFAGLLCADLSGPPSDRESVERAARSGADVILAPGDPDLAIQVLEEEAAAGRLPEASVDRSVERILAAKERLGLFADRMTDVASVETVVGGMMSRATGQRIAEAAGATLVRGDGRIATTTALLRIRDASGRVDFDSLQNELAKRATLSDDAGQCVIAIAPDPSRPEPGEEDRDRIRQAQTRYKEVIVVSFGPARPGRAESYDLVVVGGADPFSQRTAAKALAGEIPYRVAPEDFFGPGVQP